MTVATCLRPLVLVIALSACATDPKTGRNATVNRTLAGVGAGAALGAAVGSATGGGAFSGAVAGAVVGGAIGAVVNPGTSESRIYYRDTRGACYYVDANGRPRYVREARC